MQMRAMCVVVVVWLCVAVVLSVRFSMIQRTSADSIDLRDSTGSADSEHFAHSAIFTTFRGLRGAPQHFAAIQ